MAESRGSILSDLTVSVYVLPAIRDSVEILPEFFPENGCQTGQSV
jgi:hypothetical protein